MSDEAKRKPIHPSIKLSLGLGLVLGIGAALWLWVLKPGSPEMGGEAARRSRSGPPVVVWEKTFGGDKLDAGRAIAALPDGGFAVAARTRSKGAGNDDVWLLNLDAGGALRGEQLFGGPEFDWVTAMAALPDGGLVLVGSRGDKDASRVKAWALRLDPAGKKMWEHLHGGDNGASGMVAVAALAGGGLIMAGSTSSKGLGHYDAWIIRTDGDGKIDWDRPYGGVAEDSAFAIVPLADGNFIMAGSTSSSGAGAGDGWAMKLDRRGRPMWDKQFGGADYDVFNAAAATPDGGAIVVGHTRSKGQAGGAAWAMKLDKDGNAVWERLLGGTESAWANAVIALADGGAAIVGLQKKSEGSDENAFVARLDADGRVLWHQVYGGTGDDNLTAIAPLADGGFAVTGFTSSKGAGEGDVWAMRLGYPEAAKK